MATVWKLLLIIERSTGGPPILTHLPLLWPFHIQKPHFLKLLEYLPPIRMPSFCLQMYMGFPSSNILFFLTLKSLCKNVFFLSFIFLQISQIYGLPSHPPFPDHWLTPSSPARWLHRYPATENVPKVSSGLLTTQTSWDSPPPRPPYPLPFTNLDLGSISCIHTFFSVCNGRFPGRPVLSVYLSIPLSTPSCVWPPC